MTMKMLIVFFVVIQSTYNYAITSSELNSEIKTSNQDNSSKMASVSSVELLNETDNISHDTFSFHPENASTNNTLTILKSTNYPQIVENERPDEIYEDRRTDLAPLEFNTRNFTEHIVGEIIPTKTKPKNYREEFPTEISTSTAATPRSNQDLVEKKPLRVKIGESVIMTCGPDDISRLLETNPGKNLSTANMSWLWKMTWLNQSSEKQVDGIQISDSHSVVTLTIPSYRADHSGTYTCAAQDLHGKVWILKTLELIGAKDDGKVGIAERSSDENVPNNPVQSLSMSSTNADTTDPNLQSTINQDIHDPDTHQDRGNHLTSAESHPVNSLEPNSAYLSNWTSPDISTYVTSESTDVMSPTDDDDDVLSLNASKMHESDEVQTQKAFQPADDTATSFISNTSADSVVVIGPAKSEEQKAPRKEQEDGTSGVAIGVALAIILTAVATTLVLYRHRRNGKKSTYITFGNPSYSRENLPANDYGLDSPLTLSSNGYTVLA